MAGAEQRGTMSKSIKYTINVQNALVGRLVGKTV